MTEASRPNVSRGPHLWVVMGRCTMEARRVIAHARVAVHDVGGLAIATEHLVLGLLESDVRASKHLAALPIGTDQLRQHVIALLDGAPPPEAADVPLSGAAIQVLEAAWAEAEARGHAKIQSAHLLLGVLALSGAPAARLLVDQGLTTERVEAGLPGTDPDLEDA